VAKRSREPSESGQPNWAQTGAPEATTDKISKMSIKGLPESSKTPLRPHLCHHLCRSCHRRPWKPPKQAIPAYLHLGRDPFGPQRSRRTGPCSHHVQQMRAPGHGQSAELQKFNFGMKERSIIWQEMIEQT
jgi:hypothetical protein